MRQPLEALTAPSERIPDHCTRMLRDEIRRESDEYVDEEDDSGLFEEEAQLETDDMSTSVEQPTGTRVSLEDVNRDLATPIEIAQAQVADGVTVVTRDEVVEIVKSELRKWVPSLKGLIMDHVGVRCMTH